MKKARINIRIDPELKRLIEERAGACGLSLTEFLTNLAVKELEAAPADKLK